MPSMKFDEAIEEIRSRINILEIVSERVDLKRSGRSYRGLCPFHAEKTPSFYVDPDKGVYHCFGCGASGNLFRFVMDTEGVSFREAVEILAQRLGITIEYGDREDRRNPLLRILDFARTYYASQLQGPSGEGARRYLEQRGIRRDMVARFQLGYAPPTGLGLIREAERQGFPRELLQQAGLLTVTSDGRVYDLFRERLMFPVQDATGRTVGFSGRTLADAQPKYLNTPETLVFKKGRLLYGYPQARDAIRARDEAILVEGQVDVLLMHQVGYENTVAPLGTAFTEYQARQLARSTKHVLLLFDGDEAGVKAVQRTIPVLLGAGIFPRVALLPEDTDPADLASREPEALPRLMDQAVDIVDFYLQKRPETVEEGYRQMRAFVEALAGARDPVLQESFVQEAAKRYGYDLGRMREALEVLRREAVPRRGGGAAEAPRIASEEGSRWEIKLLAVALGDEALRQRLLQLPPEAFRHPLVRQMVQRVKESVAPEEALAEADAAFRAEFARIQMRLGQTDPALLRHWALEKIKKKEMRVQMAAEGDSLAEIERLKQELLRLSEQRLKGLL